MSYTVKTSIESARGCGYRKPSKNGMGLYLIGGTLSEPCERLPFALCKCPTCNSGFKASRGFTWIDAKKLFSEEIDPKCNITFRDHSHTFCYMCNPEKNLNGASHGLLWIGEGFYKTPGDFLREGAKMGISRKISTLPKNFEFGKHVIFLAHRKAIRDMATLQLGEKPEEVKYTPGVFSVFKPTKLQIVITDENNIPDAAKKLVDKLGDYAELIKVVKDTDVDLFSEATEV